MGTKYSVDIAEEILFCDNQPIHLRPRTRSVLVYLLKYKGQLVTKDELLEAVWPGVIVSETTLVGCVGELRQALRDDSKEPHYIQTVYKRGYRFIGELDALSSGASSEQQSDDQTISVVADGLNQTAADDEHAHSENKHDAGIAGSNRNEVLQDVGTMQLLQDGATDQFPVNWVVPHFRNPYFVDRQDLTQSVHQLLNSFSPNVNVLSLNGMGGVGKTQLAVEYAYRFSHEYDTVLWLDSSTNLNIGVHYGHFADELSLNEDECDRANTMIKRVRRWLEQNTGWLLVYDGFDDPEALRPYLPRTVNGHVIVTSRNPNWANYASRVTVPPFSRTESVNFLLNRTSQSDSEIATALAAEVADHPAALEHIGSYAEAVGLTLADLCARYGDTVREDLLATKSSFSSPDEDTFANRMWGASLEQVEKEDPHAWDVLSFCSVLSTTTIPRPFLSLCCGNPSPEMLDDALASLIQHSLVQSKKSEISLHPLVQLSVRCRLTSDDKQEILRQAFEAFVDQLSRTQFQLHEKDMFVQQCLPHAVALSRYAGELPHEPAIQRLEINFIKFLISMAASENGNATGEVVTLRQRLVVLAREMSSTSDSTRVLQPATSTDPSSTMQLT